MHLKTLLFSLLFFLSPQILWGVSDTSVKKIHLSPSEEAYVKSLPILRYSADPDWMPYESFTVDGSHVGVAADILKLLTERTGIKLTKIRSDSWSQVIEWMKNGEIDIFSDTDDSVLNTTMAFTKPYLSDKVVIVSDDLKQHNLSPENIVTKRMAMVKDYGYVNAFLKKYPKVSVVWVNTVTEAFQAVQDKKADYTIASEFEAARMIFLKYTTLHMAGDAGLTTNLAFAFNPKYKAMVPIFNKAIDSLTDEDRVNIKNKWMPSKIEDDDYAKFIYLGAFFIFLLSIVYYGYRNLKKELQLRRSLQLNLEREKNKFETLFTTSADGNTIVVDGKFVLCNQAFLDLLKMKREDIIGESPAKVSPEFQPDGEASSQKAQKIIQECLSKGQVRFEWVHITSNNVPVWCDIVLTKIIYNDHVSVYSQIRNIDDIKTLEASLLNLKTKAESANVAKSQFLANMSHEIRTPMNAVLGFTELLEQSEGLNGEQKGYLRSIKSGAKNLLQIINDILDLSKIEAGKMEIKPEPFDMKLFMEDLKSVFATLSQAKGLKFEIQYPSDMPPTWIMDELRLRQIIFNLIGNAFKFTEVGGITVSIVINHYDSQKQLLDVTLSVRDTGIGIAQKDISKVFKDFEQSDDQDTRKYGGTGLGLAISQKLSFAMGGDITVESEFGKGSQFSVHFPRVKCDDKHIEIETLPHGVNYSFEPATILSVDDVELNLILVRTRLKGYPFEIIEAKNGQEALEQLSKHKVDLILLDLQMPVMDGYELKRRLLESQAYRDIPVIALTAAVLETDTAKLEGLGFNGVLGKPLSNEELLHGMSQFIACSEDSDKIEASEGSSDIVLEGELKTAYIRELGMLINSENISNNFSLLSTLVESMEVFLKDHPHEGILILIGDLKNAIREFDIIAVNQILKTLRNNLEV